MTSETDGYVCFNKRGHPRGHFFSCRELYNRGVWVGYLAQDKLGEQYEGLPSFRELRDNCRGFRQPFPPSIPGKPGDERSAVCRGCIGSSSQLLSLHELQFVDKTKLVIMSLDGTDNIGMFCILIPQPNDRSLKGLQSYRPYEHQGEGANAFTSNIMLLTLRNSSQSSGTLETVRAILTSSDPRPLGEIQQLPSPIGPKQTSPVKQHIAPPPKKRKLSIRGQRSPSLKEQKHAESPTLLTQQPNQRSRETTGTLTDVEYATPSPEGIATTPEVDDQQAPPLLGKAHSKRVCLVWIVEANEIEYCFSHSLASCSHLSDYFDLVREDAADDEEVLAILEKAKVWRLTYQLPGAPKKAFTVRSGDETGYEKLLESLGKADFSGMAPNSKIDVELRALN